MADGRIYGLKWTFTTQDTKPNLQTVDGFSGHARLDKYSDFAGLNFLFGLRSHRFDHAPTTKRRSETQDRS